MEHFINCAHIGLGGAVAVDLARDGLVDLERSYALGQVALWLLLALSAYLWGRRLGGPVAGVAAAMRCICISISAARSRA